MCKVRKVMSLLCCVVIFVACSCNTEEKMSEADIKEMHAQSERVAAEVMAKRMLAQDKKRRDAEAARIAAKVMQVKDSPAYDAKVYQCLHTSGRLGTVEVCSKDLYGARVEANKYFCTGQRTTGAYRPIKVRYNIHKKKRSIRSQMRCSNRIRCAASYTKRCVLNH